MCMSDSSDKLITFAKSSSDSWVMFSLGGYVQIYDVDTESINLNAAFNLSFASSGVFLFHNNK